jgi:hypothetical protein
MAVQEWWGSGGLIADPERVSLYVSKTRLPRLSESDGGQGSQSRREFINRQDGQNFSEPRLKDRLSAPCQGAGHPRESESKAPPTSSLSVFSA